MNGKERLQASPVALVQPTSVRIPSRFILCVVLVKHRDNFTYT